MNLRGAPKTFRMGDLSRGRRYQMVTVDFASVAKRTNELGVERLVLCR